MFPTETPPLPTTFGKYTLVKLLGKGGTAEIFLGRDGGSAPVVIKRLLPELSEEKEFLALLIGEAKVASLLNHPAICRVHELGKEGGQVYLAMEYVPGWDLRSVAKAAGGRVPFRIAARVGLAVAEALAHAHRCTDLDGSPLHLVHRDVTPSNVMITPLGEVKLIDFGIAKATTQLHFTQPGIVRGKIRFLSPEQIEQKPLDGRSDLFSLGVGLYEVTTGRRAFSREQPIDIFKAILREQPDSPQAIVPDYPQGLQAVIQRLLEKRPEHRFADAEALAAALRALLPSLPGEADLGEYVRGLAREKPKVLPMPEPAGETEATSLAVAAPAPAPAPPRPVSASRPPTPVPVANGANAERPRPRRPKLVFVNLPDRAEPLPPRRLSPVLTAASLPPEPVSARPEPKVVLPGAHGQSEPAWTTGPAVIEPPVRGMRSAPRGGRPRWLPVLGLLALVAATALGTWLVLAELRPPAGAAQVTK